MLQPIEQCPEVIIIKQGDLSSSIFFCLKGRLSVHIINHFNEDVEVLPELTQYKIFGEIAYTLKTPRTATITCIDYVSLMQLHAAEGYIFEKVQALCIKQYKKYKESYLKFSTRVLKLSVDWLEGVDDSLMQCFCYNLKKENFKKGDVLIDVGEKMNKIIIIQ